MAEEEEGAPDGVEIVELDEVEQLKGRVAELEQELQYYAADISNIRQKAAKDRSQAIRFGSSSLAKKILPLCLLYTSPIPRDIDLARMPSGA